MAAHVSIGQGLMKLLAFAALALCLSCAELGVEDKTAAAAASFKQKQQRLDVKRHLQRLNKPPVKSIQSPDGDIIDCVHISQQPAFDHPFLKNHTIQLRPSFHPEGLLTEAKTESRPNPDRITQMWHLNGKCPQDTVPIRRTKGDDVMRASSIKRFGRKKHRAIPQPPQSADPDIINQNGHQHAIAYVEGDNYYGAKATINVWEPRIQQPNEFSLSQLWILGGSFGQDLNSIEAGWQISPELYGDNKTRLFTYWTSDAYQATGCYNLLCSGFIQISNEIAMGASIYPISGYGGSQYDISILVWKDPKEGNWWMHFGNDYVLGYWPSFLFSYLADSASMIEWGGEVVNSEADGEHTSTQMGSGFYLDDNLKLTPQAMSDKATPMDELEDMHQRVISSSLMAIAILVEILLGTKFQSDRSESINTAKARAATLASAERMFSVHNFYLEFFKSKSPVIRSAAYSVQTSLIKHIPHVYSENNMKTMSAAILGVFQEKDASCHSSMWDMVLLFSRKFPDCWSLNNIQKVVVSRLWNFLRHGCYGSPQISYPALVVFLESVPSTSVGGEQFIINFFQSMWAGRNPLHSSTADSLAFFKALKECFIWALNNASRFNMCVNATNPLPGKLVSNILVSLLWRDYHLFVNLKTKDESLSQMSNSSAEEGIEISDARTSSYPISYVEELGKCIIGILSDISTKEIDLLTIFSTMFHKDCSEIFQQGEHQTKFPQRVERISNFFRLLYQFVWQKGQTWPLHYLAGPLFASSYRITKSMDSPDSVRFLYVLVELFGPVTLFSYLRICNEGQSSINSADDTTNETRANIFLQTFRDDFVPWCLNGHTCSRSEKVDLLIASVEDEFFTEQWSSIITYATNVEKVSETGMRTLDVETEILAILIEKVKERINKTKITSVYKIGYLPDHWQHELLDARAVSVALHSSSCISDARFLRAVLGGSYEDDKFCFLSEAAVISVFQEILKKLVIFLSTSSIGWSRLSSSLLLSRSMDLEQIQQSSADRLKMAEFAFEVIEGSLFCVKILDEDCRVFSCIMAAIFIIDWECGMLSCMSEGSSESCKYLFAEDSVAASTNFLDDHLQEQLDLKLILGRRIHAFRHKISASFWTCLGYKTLSTVRNILVQTVRSAAFETNTLTSDRISSLCCEWMMDMLEVTCHDQAELQSVLDQLLMEDDSWPMWVAPNFVDGRRSAKIQDKTVNIAIKEVRHNQFISFVEKLCSSLGFSKMIGGFAPQTPVPLAVTSTEHVSPFSSLYSRAWLAVELFCTWKWQGGSALDSFLPSLSRYAKCESSYPEINVVSSIVNILLDGAIFKGANCMWISLNTWVASDDEVEDIQDPFLRALSSLLLTLFVKDKVWRKHEALELFENIVGRLSIDTAVERTCLKILPFILSILIEPLLLQNTEFDEASKDTLLAPWNNESVLKNLLSWLRKALSFPPLRFGLTEPADSDGWIQLIISCYPLRLTGIPGTCKVDVVRDIGHLEKPLLLSLFQKQRCGDDVSRAISEMSSAASSTRELALFSPSQMALGKLTALSVGYCWMEFSEADWDFVFDSVKRWIESSVLLMEELTEKIDETVTRYTSKSNFELVEELKLIVLALDPMAINISGSALLVLSLFSQLTELQEADSSEALQSVKLEKWPKIKDQIMENILRLFLVTGAAEAMASLSSDEASSIVASSRAAYSQFWGQVASFVISSPHHIRNAAVKSMALWGLSKGPISSLYAILFSSKPIPALQFAAYWLLSTEPLCHLSLLKENIRVGITTTSEDSNLNNFESSSEDSVSLMDEIYIMIQRPASMIFEMDLGSPDRVTIFLAWAILLSYLHSLSPSSSARERLIQYIQESISSAILDCIFQHIPLKQGPNNIKKKDADLVVEASIAASAAKHVICSGSVFLRADTLWPRGTKQMASLAGSIYGMMIWLLPSYVRNWFTSLRDRAHVSAIELFTKLWCSPSLLLHELSQVKENVVTDENFSVSVNKSAYEIIATYTKEETGMDLVIRLPNCYPLRPVDVDCTRSLGISEVKKRKWLLSLTAFIRNQNGAVGEAIRTWKNNLDKEFLGVEECPICYSIIHTTNHSLPRLACKTCKHKFHSACLYKWFSTSHKSTCPLCQTPF